MPFDGEPTGLENNFDQSKTPELQESEIKELLREFRSIIEDAPEIVEDGTEILFPRIESYDELGKHQDKTWEIVKDVFDFDIKGAGSPVREYVVEGTPGEEGEGTIKVSLFKTNNPNIFVGKYEYANGDKCWSLRPNELEDEI